MQFRLLLAAFVAALLPVGAATAQSVGVASAVNQSTTGTAPSSAPRTMVIGDQVIHNEKISTDGKGLLQILLADGTSFTVGPSSSITIDSFVYDPTANTAKVVATLGKGVFRFIGGRTSKSPDGAVLNTPVGTVGIRGGISDLDFSGHGGHPFHIDMVFGDSITLSQFGHEIGRIYAAGYSIIVGPDGQHVTIVKTPPGWTEAFQHDIKSPGGQHGGAPHGATATVETAFQPTTQPSSPGTTPSPTDTTGTTQLADTTPPNQIGVVDATWAEINNSDMAGNYANYAGTYSATTTITGVASAGTYSSSGDFNLYYYFTDHNGGGVAIFGPDRGQGQIGSLEADVAPVDANGTGTATYQSVTTQSFGAQDGDVTAWGAGTLTIQGTFTDSPAGVATGTSGTINANANLYEEGESPVGTITSTGTFSGTAKPGGTPG